MMTARLFALIWTAFIRADRTEEKRWDTVPATVSLSLEPFAVQMLVVR